jgi:N utilization substance protein B
MAHAPNPHHRRQWSRRLLMQAIYQWQMTGQDIGEIEHQFYDDENMHKADVTYFHELLHRVPATLDELDACLSEHLDRAVNEVDPVERAVLRNACYELIYRRDVPYKVVINEAVNLTKKFGAEQAYKFVNGVLDKLVRKLSEVSPSKNTQV